MRDAEFRALFPRASKAFAAANAATLTHPARESAKSAAARGSKGMTGTEREYSMQLEAMKRRGEIFDWKFEGITLRLADRCRYTPDFFVIVAMAPLRLRFCEIKGRHVWDDSKVKFKVAREQNKWAEWELHQKTKGGWRRIEK